MRNLYVRKWGFGEVDRGPFISPKGGEGRDREDGAAACEAIDGEDEVGAAGSKRVGDVESRDGAADVEGVRMANDVVRELKHDVPSGVAVAHRGAGRAVPEDQFWR